MSEVIVLVSPGNETGFQLAGFHTQVIEASEATVTMDMIFREGKYGLVCIEDSLFQSVKKDIADRILKSGLPVVIPVHIPDSFEGGDITESHIARLIRRTIGYQINLKK